MMDWEMYEDKVIESKGAVDATDPCYDNDVRCKVIIPLMDGKYRCWYSTMDSGCWGERVQACAILREGLSMSDYMEIGRTIGTIGVDAGMAGFFVNKPNYTDREWRELCEDLNRRNWPFASHNDAGFFTSSGFGDGEYPVEELLYNGKRVGAMITFINEKEEE